MRKLCTRVPCHRETHAAAEQHRRYVGSILEMLHVGKAQRQTCQEIVTIRLQEVVLGGCQKPHPTLFTTVILTKLKFACRFMSLQETCTHHTTESAFLYQGFVMCRYRCNPCIQSMSS